MFNSALNDKQLLDCLDWLEDEMVEVDSPGGSANDRPSRSVIRAMLIQATDEKLMQLIHLANANIMDNDNPMVSVTHKVDPRGQATTTRSLMGCRVDALCRLAKLIGVTGIDNDQPYLGQTESNADRAIRKAQTLGMQLGFGPNLINGEILNRHRGPPEVMHQHTYDQLLAQYIHARTRAFLMV